MKVSLTDGTTKTHDLLVGADGIWSQIRAQMYNEGPVRGTSADGKVKQGCPYSGYTVFAGEAVLPLNDYYDVGYNVYIGPQSVLCQKRRRRRAGPVVRVLCACRPVRRRRGTPGTRVARRLTKVEVW